MQSTKIGRSKLLRRIDDTLLILLVALFALLVLMVMSESDAVRLEQQRVWRDRYAANSEAR